MPKPPLPSGPVRIVSVVNEKGGVGKTTTTMSLAAVAAVSLRVLAVDTDPQGSLSWWAERAEANGLELPFEYAQADDPASLGLLRRQPFDVVFVDTPGSLEKRDVIGAVVRESDYLVLPTEAATLSIPPLMRTVRELVLPSGLPFRVLLNRTKHYRRGAASEVRAVLAAYGVPLFGTAVRDYGAHEAAPNEGLVVTQYPRGRDTTKAVEDYERVAGEMFADWQAGPIVGRVAG